MVNVTDVINQTAQTLNGTGIDPQAANNSIQNSLWSTASTMLAGFLNAVSERLLGKTAGVTPELASWLLLGVSLFFLIRKASNISRIAEQLLYVLVGVVLIFLALVYIGVKF